MGKKSGTKPDQGQPNKSQAANQLSSNAGGGNSSLAGLSAQSQPVQTKAVGTVHNKKSPAVTIANKQTGAPTPAMASNGGKGSTTMANQILSPTNKTQNLLAPQPSAWAPKTNALSSPPNVASNAQPQPPHIPPPPASPTVSLKGNVGSKDNKPIPAPPPKPSNAQKVSYMAQPYQSYQPHHFPPLSASGHQPSVVATDVLEKLVNQSRHLLAEAGEYAGATTVKQHVRRFLAAEMPDAVVHESQLSRVIASKGIPDREQRIGAYVESFLAARYISTLSDLSDSLDAFVEKEYEVSDFNKLSLGPLLKQPVIQHYFLDADKIANDEKATWRQVRAEHVYTAFAQVQSQQKFGTPQIPYEELIAKLLTTVSEMFDDAPVEQLGIWLQRSVKPCITFLNRNIGKFITEMWASASSIKETCKHTWSKEWPRAIKELKEVQLNALTTLADQAKKELQDIFQNKQTELNSSLAMLKPLTQQHVSAAIASLITSAQSQPNQLLKKLTMLSQPKLQKAKPAKAHDTVSLPDMNDALAQLQTFLNFGEPRMVQFDKELQPALHLLFMTDPRTFQLVRNFLPFIVDEREAVPLPPVPRKVKTGKAVKSQDSCTTQQAVDGAGSAMQETTLILDDRTMIQGLVTILQGLFQSDQGSNGDAASTSASMHVDDTATQSVAEKLIKLVAGAAQVDERLALVLSSYWKHDALLQLLLKAVSLWMRHGSPFKPIKEAADEHASMHKAGPRYLKKASMQELEELVAASWKGSSVSALADLEQTVTEHFGVESITQLQLPDGHTSMIGFLRHTVDQDLTGWECSNDTGPEDIGPIRKDQVLHVVQQLQHVVRKQQLQHPVAVIGNALCAHFRVPNVLHLGYGSVERLLEEAKLLGSGNDIAEVQIGSSWVALAVPRRGIPTLDSQTRSKETKRAVTCLSSAPILADLSAWCDWPAMYETVLGALPTFLQDHSSSLQFRYIEMPGKVLLKVPHEGCHDVPTLKDQWQKAIEQNNPELFVGLLLGHVSVKGGAGFCELELLQSVLESLLRRTAAANNTTGAANNTITTFMAQCLQLLPLPVASALITKLLLPSFEGALGRKTNMHKQLLSAAVALDSKRTYHGYVSYSGQPSAQQRLHTLGHIFDIDAWKTEHVTKQYVPEPVSQATIPMLTLQHAVPTVQTPSQATNATSIGTSVVRLDESGILNMHETATAPDAPSTPTALEGDVAGFSNGIAADIISSTGVVASTGNDMLAVAERSKIDTANQQTNGDGEHVAVTSTSELQVAEAQSMTPQQALIEDIRSEYKLTADGKADMTDKGTKRQANLMSLLAEELYATDTHFVMELVQNADDNTYDPEVVPQLELLLTGRSATVLNNEQGFNDKCVRGVADMGASTKKGLPDYTGQKGIGFKSVFKVTDCAAIHSNGYHFCFNSGPVLGKLGYCVPTWIPTQSNHDELPVALSHSKLAQSLLSAGGMGTPESLLEMDGGMTAIHLPLKPDLSDEVSSSLQELHPTILLFLRKLRHVAVTDIRSGKCMEMCCEKEEAGVVRLFVRHWSGPSYSTLVQDVKESRWLIVTQTIYHGETRRRDYLVERTSVSIAFALDGTVPTKQGVFAYLPVDKKFGLHFIVQGDFVLTTSRADVDVNNTWNKLLASAVPSLFVQAFEKFKDPAHLPSRDDPLLWLDWWLRCVPLEEHGIEDFFASVPSEVCGMLRGMECIPVQATDVHSNGETDHHTASNNHGLKWVLPVQALICTSLELRELFPPRQLAEQGQYLVHPSIKVLNEEEGHGQALRQHLGVRKLDQQKVIELVKAQAEQGSLMRDGDMQHLQRLLLCLATARGKQLRPLQHVPLLPVYGRPAQELHAAQLPLLDTDEDQDMGCNRMYFSPWAMQGATSGAQATSLDSNVAQHRQLLELCNISIDQLAGLTQPSNPKAATQAAALRFVDPALLELKKPEDVENMRKLLKELGVQELTRDIVVTHYLIPTMKLWAERVRTVSQTDKSQHTGVATAAASTVPQMAITQLEARQLIGLLQYLLMSGKLSIADLHEQTASHYGQGHCLLTELRSCTVVVTARGTAALLQHHAKGTDNNNANSASGDTASHTVFLTEQLGAKHNLQNLFPTRASSWTFIHHGYLSSLRNWPASFRTPGMETWKALFVALGAQTFLPVVSKTVRMRASQLPSHWSSAASNAQNGDDVLEFLDWECPEIKLLFDAIESDRTVNTGRWRGQICALAIVITDVWREWKRSGYLAAKYCSAGDDVGLDDLEFDDGRENTVANATTFAPAANKDLPSTLLQQLKDMEWIPASDGQTYRANQLFQDTDAITRVFGRHVPFPAHIVQIDKAAYDSMLVDLGIQTRADLQVVIGVLQTWSSGGSHKRSQSQMLPSTQPVQAGREWVASLSQMRALYHHLSSLLGNVGKLPMDGWTQLECRTGSDELLQRMQAWWVFSHEPLIWLPDHSALVKAINQAQEANVMDHGYDQYGGYNSYGGMSSVQARGRGATKAKSVSPKLAATDLLDPAKNTVFLERIASIVDTHLTGRFYHAHEVCYSDYSLTLELMNVIVTANRNSRQPSTPAMHPTNADSSKASIDLVPPRILSLYYEPNCFVNRQKQQLAGLFTDQLRRLGPAVPNWPEGEWWSCVGGFGGFPSHAHFCEAMQAMLQTAGNKSDATSLEYELVIRVMRSWSESIAGMLMRERAQQALKEQLLMPGCNVFPTMAGTWAHLTDNLIQPDDAALLPLFNNEPQLAFLRLPADAGLEPLLRMLDIPCLSELVHQLPPSCSSQEASPIDEPADEIVTYLTASMPMLQRLLLQQLGQELYKQLAPTIAQQLSQFKCCKVQQLHACFELRKPDTHSAENHGVDSESDNDSAEGGAAHAKQYSVIVRKQKPQTALLASSAHIVASEDEQQQNESETVCSKLETDLLLATKPDGVGYDFKAIAEQMTILIDNLVSSIAATAPAASPKDVIVDDGTSPQDVKDGDSALERNEDKASPTAEADATANQPGKSNVVLTAENKEAVKHLLADLLIWQELGRSMELKQQLEPYCSLPALPDYCNNPWSLWVKPPPPPPPISAEEEMRTTLAAALAGELDTAEDVQEASISSNAPALPILNLRLQESEEDRAMLEEMEMQDANLRRRKEAKLAEGRAKQQEANAQAAMQADVGTNAEASLSSSGKDVPLTAPMPPNYNPIPSLTEQPQTTDIKAVQTLAATPMPPTYDAVSVSGGSVRNDSTTGTAAMSAGGFPNSHAERRHTSDGGTTQPSSKTMRVVHIHEGERQALVPSSDTTEFPPLASKASGNAVDNSVKEAGNNSDATAQHRTSVGTGERRPSSGGRGDEAPVSRGSANVEELQQASNITKPEVPGSTQRALPSSIEGEAVKTSDDHSEPQHMHAADSSFSLEHNTSDSQHGQETISMLQEGTNVSDGHSATSGKVNVATTGRTGHHIDSLGYRTGRGVSMHGGHPADGSNFDGNNHAVTALANELLGTMQIVEPALPLPPYSGDIQLLQETAETFAVGRGGEHAVHQHLLQLQANNQLLSYFNRVHGYQAGILGSSSRGVIGIAWVNEHIEMMRPYDILVYEYQPGVAMTSPRSPHTNPETATAATMPSPRQTKPSLTAICDAVDRFEPLLNNSNSLCLNVSGTAGMVLLAAIEVKCTTDPRKAASFELSAFESECARVKKDWYQIWRLAQNSNGSYSVRQLTNPHSLWREKKVTVQVHVSDSSWDAKTNQE